MCFGLGRGGGESTEDELATAKNRQIDKMLRTDEKRASKEIKLLLLGAGESGKSTILKQMRLIYAKGFSRAEKEEWRAIIFNNLLSAFRVVLDAMEELGIVFAVETNDQYIALILMDRAISPRETLPNEYLRPFKSLWADAGVQQAVEKGNQFALHDNLRYFFKDVDRLFEKDYIPSDQDVLRSRLRTTGITETVFDLGALTYRMFDVGGQRSERKKWIHCFEDVNCLLFLVAISGYDQCLVEDKAGNQMQEALMLWESIANSEWFRRTALILFLNKVDLFKEKVPKSDVTKQGFTDYRGDTKDWRLVSKYFMDKFRALHRFSSREIYGHFTNATDTNLLKITMASVQDMIIQKNLNQLIL